MTDLVHVPGLDRQGLRVERLYPEDRARVADLCRRATDFFALVEGAPASEATAAEVLEVGPPGVDASEKFVLGFLRGDTPVGIVDLIDGYPTQGVWCVGLFVVESGR